MIEKDIRVSIYYMNGYGYVTTYQVLDVDSRLPIKHFCERSKEKNIVIKELSKMIKNSIEQTNKNIKINSEIRKDNKFSAWYNAGCKSWKQFAQSFNSVLIEVLNDKYIISRCLYESKYHSHELSRNKEDIVELPITSSLDEVAGVAKMLLEKEQIKEIYDVNKKREIKTYEDAIITYSCVPEYLEDHDDYHTDAYKVYIDEENSNNYFAFMLIAFFEGLSEGEVRDKVEKHYGNILDFKFEKFENEEYKITAKTETTQLIVLGLNDNDGLFEVVAELDLVNTKKLRQKRILADYKKIIKSIKVKL